MLTKATSSSSGQTSKRNEGGSSSGGWLPIFAKYGGFGGLVLFVFIVLFSKFGDLKPLFGNLDAGQTYNIIVFFMLLVFIFSVFALVVWVVTNNQKREVRAVRVGLLVLMALVLCGVAAWATVNGTKEHISESLGQSPEQSAAATPAETVSVRPPDLEAHDWNLSVRTSGLPPFEGRAKFSADNTFEAVGHFLVPTGALNEHLTCPGNLKGTWSYAPSDHRSLQIENLGISQMSDYHISPDEYRQCSSVLMPLLPVKVTKTCTFQYNSICMTEGLEMHFAP